MQYLYSWGFIYTKTVSKQRFVLYAAVGGVAWSDTRASVSFVNVVGVIWEGVVLNYRIVARAKVYVEPNEPLKGEERGQR